MCARVSLRLSVFLSVSLCFSLSPFVSFSDYVCRIKGMEGLALCGTPLVSVVAFESPIFDIYRLGGMLTERGWNLNSLQFPSR